MHKSSVARIREQIALEYQAAQLALYGYNVAAAHSIIDHKYTQIGVLFEQLKQEMGEQQALSLLIEILDREE